MDGENWWKNADRKFTIAFTKQYCSWLTFSQQNPRQIAWDRLQILPGEIPSTARTPVVGGGEGGRQTYCEQEKKILYVEH
jgi:hypothetical protein